jgi:cysteine-S-conjugate beta-lyase
VPKGAIDAMLDGLELFGKGVGFGGFESLAIPMDPTPYRSATRWTSDGESGAEHRYVRLHVGVEDPGDLIADLEKGFARLRAAAGSER